YGHELIKIPGLDGSGKMGKSEGNCVYLCDEPKVIEKKMMKALTDSGPTERNSVKPEYIENLFTILKVVSTPDTYDYFNEKWNKCEIRYGDLKKQLAADVIKVTAPIRERYNEISNDEAYLHKVVTEGAEKARASALKTIVPVREIMGFKPF
ncbi:MAG: tryptophan--tRNA ligase, partial [Bacteroidales bacterium]|nr:tryptophan--tRNA ligase [Bacteroidales bacterium]